MTLDSAKQRAAGGPGLEIDVIVNTGDDLEVHGLTVCPDLDTVMYTLAGLANPDTGWGVDNETWSTTAMFERYGAPTWFRLGDRDMATHVARTKFLRTGQRLTLVTQTLTTALGVPARLLPMSDDPVRTEIATPDGWLEFQDYFVKRGHRDEVRAIRHAGADTAHPTPEVLASITAAELIVFAPSNPFVSIGTILAVPGILDALKAASAPLIAVSPIVAGAALRGPADAMLTSLGGEATATGVASHYAAKYPGLVDAFVLDTSDADLAAAVSKMGITPFVTSTVMHNLDDRAALAAALLARFAESPA
jgi:LPPG:FO 2-phospho-L-lactate transferase